MKKIVLLLTVVLLLIIGGAVYYFVPNPSTEEQMEEDVREYLFEERGYTEDDILNLEVRFSSLKETGKDRYHTIVYFKDEPENDYGYQWYDGEIKPSYIGNGKHNPESLE